MAALAICTAVPADAAWEVHNGDPTNSGFANVDTAPATLNNLKLFRGPTFLTAPVVAQDGTAYVGTRDGWLFAIKPDATVKWQRDIMPKGHQIYAAPAIAGDGSIFVLSSLRYSDHSSGQSQERFEATLHHFSAGGAYLGATPFPDRFQGPATWAAPNIVRVGSDEAIVVPALYPNRVTAGYEVRLLAFSVAAVPEVIADTKVRTFVPTVSGGPVREDSWVCRSPIPVLNYLTCLGLAASGFDGASPRPVRGRILPPLPAVAVFTPHAGAAPHVLVSDADKSLVDFTFSFANGFTLVSDTKTSGYVRSSPMVMPGGQRVLGLQNVIEGDYEIGEQSGPHGLVYLGGPNTPVLRPVVAQAPVYATPVRTINGAIVVVEPGKGIAVLTQFGKIVSRVPIADALSAVASRTHIFVAAPSALRTLDASSLAEVGRGSGSGGGLAIAPDGHVYAVAKNVLFIFPPVAQPTLSGQVFEAVDVLNPPLSPSAATTPKPLVAGAPGRFKDPKGPGGLALYACTAVGGDVCERPVAVKFCQSQGFAKVAKYDTDNKKMKAVTLGGEICTKKRCRVFEYIECRN
jgi:hypothetical protein